MLNPKLYSPQTQLTYQLAFKLKPHKQVHERLERNDGSQIGQILEVHPQVRVPAPTHVILRRQHGPLHHGKSPILHRLEQVNRNAGSRVLPDVGLLLDRAGLLLLLGRCSVGSGDEIVGKT